MTIPAKGAKHVIIEGTRARPWGSRWDVGYFKTVTDMVAAGFKEAQLVGIDDIMDSMQIIDVDRCLAIMNSHWQ